MFMERNKTLQLQPQTLGGLSDSINCTFILEYKVDRLYIMDLSLSLTSKN